MKITIGGHVLKVNFYDHYTHPGRDGLAMCKDCKDETGQEIWIEKSKFRYHTKGHIRKTYCNSKAIADL